MYKAEEFFTAEKKDLYASRPRPEQGYVEPAVAVEKFRDWMRTSRIVEVEEGEGRAGGNSMKNG